MTNAEFNDYFRKRTRDFAIKILKLINLIPYNTSTKIITYQLGKSATSVGSNFRTFCRGRSKAEKFARICIVVEEADECEYWLDLLNETNYGNKGDLRQLLNETLEIVKVSQKIKSSLSPPKT